MNPRARQELVSFVFCRPEQGLEMVIPVDDVAGLVERAGAAGVRAAHDDAEALLPLSAEETEMLICFRALPDNTTRRACLDALRDFLLL